MAINPSEIPPRASSQTFESDDAADELLRSAEVIIEIEELYKKVESYATSIQNLLRQLPDDAQFPAGINLALEPYLDSYERLQSVIGPFLKKLSDEPVVSASEASQATEVLQRILTSSTWIERELADVAAQYDINLIEVDGEPANKKYDTTEVQDAVVINNASNSSDQPIYDRVPSDLPTDRSPLLQLQYGLPDEQPVIGPSPEIIEERFNACLGRLNRIIGGSKYVFEHLWWNELSKIRSDFDIFLQAVGYTRDEIQNFFKTRLNPLCEEIVKVRRERPWRKSDTLSQNKSFAPYKEQLFSVIYGMVQGRSVNTDALRSAVTSTIEYELRKKNGPASGADNFDSVPTTETINPHEHSALDLELRIRSHELLHKVATLALTNDPEVSALTQRLSDEMGKISSDQFGTSEVSSQLDTVEAALDDLDAVLTKRQGESSPKTAEQPTGASSAETVVSERFTELAAFTAALDARAKEAYEIDNSGQFGAIESDEQKKILFREADKLAEEKIQSIKDNADLTPEQKLEEIEGVNLNTHKYKKRLNLQQSYDQFKAAAEEAVKEMIAIRDNDTLTLEQKLEAIREVETALYNLETRINRQEAKAAWRESNAAWREARDEYDQALEDHYKNQGIGTKLKRGVNKLLGKKEGELPEEIQKLEAKWRALRHRHATNLDAALMARQSANDAENVVTQRRYEAIEQSDATKIAFTRKFILKPAARRFEMQQRQAPSEVMKRFTRLQSFMRQHKNKIRGLVIIGAATVGALSGGALIAGLAAGSITAGRMAASVAIGSVIGKGVNVIGQRIIKEGSRRIIQNEERISTKFSLEALDAQEGELAEWVNETEKYSQDAAQALRSVEAQVNVATMLAAGGAGFAAGGVTASQLGDTFFGGTRASAPEDLPPTVEGTFSVAQIRDMKIDVLNPRVPNVVVQGIYIQSGIPDANIATEHRVAMTGTVRSAIENAVLDNPNITKADLERAAFAELEATYGKEAWWNAASISKVDIGTLTNDATVRSDVMNSDAPAASVLSGDEARIQHLQTEASAAATQTVRPEGTAATVPEEIHKVEKGQTLWGIMQAEAQESGLFKDLTKPEQDALLARLFERVKANPELMQSIGLDSKNNIDLIYAGETINTAVLEQELAKLVHEEVTVERSTASGSVRVTDAGSSTQRVGILSKAETDALVDRYKDDLWEKTGSASVASQTPEFIPPPTYIGGVANQLENSDYKAYIAKYYGSTEYFNTAVKSAAKAFEANTYDVIETTFGIADKYASPYDFFKNMTMAEITAWRNSVPMDANLREINGQPNPNSMFGDTTTTPPQMKYETYQAWMKQIDTMKRDLGAEPGTKLSDLFSRYIIENQAQRQLFNK